MFDAEKERFLVHFWGVRGSYPTPGAHTLRHGGNTSCVEVQVYFPVDVRELPSHRTFHTVVDEQCISWSSGSAEPVLNGRQGGRGRSVDEEKVRVLAKFSNSHPLNGSIVYRVEYHKRSLVYATDVEWRDGCDAGFLRFIEGADVLIHDAQYTTGDYQQEKQGFGHSTLEMATQAARDAHVHELILFHHEPTYSDSQLDAMEAEARKSFKRTTSAYEGMKIDLFSIKN